MAGLLSAPLQQPAGEPDERVAVAEHQPEANHPERDRRHSEDDEVLGQDVDGVLRLTETAFHERESGVHPEHQEGGQQDPEGIQGNLGFRIDCGICDARRCQRECEQ